MEITITKQHTQTINLPVPCFWTNGLRWIGLIDEKTMITFVRYDGKCEIASHLVPSQVSQIWLEATQTDKDYAVATDEQYFEAYDQALKSITITPILKTW